MRVARLARAAGEVAAEQTMAFAVDLVYFPLVPKSSVVTAKQRSEESILDQATLQLIRATKAEAKKRGKSVNPETLRKEGFSERFIAKVQEA